MQGAGAGHEDLSQQVLSHTIHPEYRRKRARSRGPMYSPSLKPSNVEMDTSRLNQYRRLLAFSLLGVCVLWSYWPTLGELADRWAHDPQYSHGYLVPLFSLYLIWRKRRELAKFSAQSSWWGVGFIVFGMAIRLAGAYIFLPWLDAVSLIPTLTGLCLLFGSWPALRCCWPAIAFLAFMLPLPHRFQTALAQPLQQIATLASVYLLETCGLPAVSRGNIILINDTRIMVVEACNGLSMLVTFVALSAAVALLIRRGWIERIVILGSAIPIALVANILRITVSALLTETAGAQTAGVFFHDLAGWLMMPLGLALLGLVLYGLRRLLVEDQSNEPTTVPGAQQLAAASESEKPRNEVVLAQTY
jgi:exosortase